jgi:hypothetical protein
MTIYLVILCQKNRVCAVCIFICVGLARTVYTLTVYDHISGYSLPKIPCMHRIYIYMCRVSQNRICIYIYTYTVYDRISGVIPLPKLLYIHRIYRGLPSPTLLGTLMLWYQECGTCFSQLAPFSDRFISSKMSIVLCPLGYARTAKAVHSTSVLLAGARASPCIFWGRSFKPVETDLLSCPDF